MRRLRSEGRVPPRRPETRSESPGHNLTVYRINAAPKAAQCEPELQSLLTSRFLHLIENRNILIKYNLNTAEPYPASVSPEMLKTLAGILHKLGAQSVTAGDCCTIRLLPTKNQVKKAGLAEALEGRAKLICFDDLPWVTIPLEGQYLKSVTVPRIAHQADTIIALANLKTHFQADYTGALKLAVGFMHPLERRPLHRENLQEKIAEINLALQSDLYIMDARVAMISGGPDQGPTAAANTLLVSDNPLALDFEAYKLLYRLKVEHDYVEGYREDPFSLAQLSYARDIGIGGLQWAGCDLRPWPNQ